MSPLIRREEDDMERLVYVYWFWMEKRAKPLLDTLPVANLRQETHMHGLASIALKHT